MFRAENSAVALLNSAGAEVLDGLLRGDSDAHVARDILPNNHVDDKSAHDFVAQFHRQLKCEGLVGELAPPENELQAHGDVHFPTSFEYERCIGLGRGVTVKVQCTQARLAKLLDAALAPLAQQAGARTPSRVSIATNETGYCIWREDVLIGTALDLATVRRVCLEVVLMALLSPIQVATVLHAGAVGLGDGATLLIGATGSGKTTLMLETVGRGAEYLSDDLVPLARDGRTVAAYPFAASVKAQSWPLGCKYFPELGENEIHNVGERRVRYLDLSERSPSADSQPVKLMIFPHFQSGAAFQCNPLTPEHALSRILQCGSDIVGQSRTIAPLAELVNNVPAVAMNYGNVDEAATAVWELQCVR